MPAAFAPFVTTEGFAFAALMAAELFAFATLVAGPCGAACLRRPLPRAATVVITTVLITCGLRLHKRRAYGQRHHECEKHRQSLHVDLPNNSLQVLTFE
jgi:hypothetical protein